MIALDPRFLTAPIAHRALHDVEDGRPENSRAAIQAAIEAGYGIEIDLQLSSDGVPMVFHDYRLNRLAQANGYVGEHSANDLAAILLKGGDEGIPALDEVLSLVAGQVPLLIEFKAEDRSMGSAGGTLETGAAQFLNSYQGPIAVMSFNPHSVARLAHLCPDIPRGLVTSAFDPDVWTTLTTETCGRLRDIPDYDLVEACFISHEAQDLHRPRVADLKSQGAHILCWTVTSAAMEAEVREIADNITFEQYLAKHPA